MVYVINKDGTLLMPCSVSKARHLLEAGKAKVVRKTPFTIKLLWDCERNIQEVVAGMDTGSKVIGCAAITNGQVVYQSEVQIRQDVSSKMEQRRMYRRNRRNRKTRYRKPRWLNRASMRREGRLAPSILSKVNSHLREKKFVESILPVSKWVVEAASFDIHKISNPDVEDYRNGKQKGFYNVKAYVLHRDGYQCWKCKGKDRKLNVHHALFKSQDGSNSPGNLITLCENCHESLHRGEFSIKGKKSVTKHATEVGVVKAQLEKQFGPFEETFGYETKWKREQVLMLFKSHVNDAVAICCGDDEIVSPGEVIYKKKHVSKGDYQQTCGSRSEKKIPTGKLFGFRKFDLVGTTKGIGFIKGKRSTGFFAISNLDSNVVSPSVNVKKNSERIQARSTTLTERRSAHSSTPQADVVSCA